MHEHFKETLAAFDDCVSHTAQKLSTAYEAIKQKCKTVSEVQGELTSLDNYIFFRAELRSKFSLYVKALQTLHNEEVSKMEIK